LLADRTITVALMLQSQCCVRLSSVVYVRNVLWLNGAFCGKSYYWSWAYRKSHMRNRLVPKWMTLTS